LAPLLLVLLACPAPSSSRKSLEPDSAAAPPAKPSEMPPMRARDLRDASRLGTSIMDLDGRPRPATRVKAETPTVVGPLDRNIVEREVRMRLVGVQHCYERRLRDHPQLRGRLELRWTIGPAGTTRDVTIGQDSVGDPEASGCVQSLVRRWRFPAPSGDRVKVVFPLLLVEAPDGGQGPEPPPARFR
jgi:hypothetical protein